MRIIEIINKKRINEGWKTNTAIGAGLGALAGSLSGYSPIDTQAGAAAGAFVGGALTKKYDDWKNQRNKDKSQRALDDKLKKHAWDNHVSDWYNYIYELKKEAFARLGGWSDFHRPGYEFVPGDEEDDTLLYMNKKLWKMLSIIEEHHQEEIIKIAISKKTEEQKIKEFQNIGTLAAAEFQKYKKVGESVDHSLAEDK